MIPLDEYQPAQETFRRIHWRGNQIDSRTDTLHETKTFGSLYKPFGSQYMVRLNPANQRLGIDTRLYETFFRLKRLMRMRLMCPRLFGSHRKIPSIRRKQHRRADASLNSQDNGRPRSQALYPFLNLIAPVRRHEIQFIQDQQVG